MDIEFLLRAKVIYDTPVKGRTYHRRQLEIQLPEEFKDWEIVPTFPSYGGEAFLNDAVLRVNIRKLKDGDKNV